MSFINPIPADRDLVKVADSPLDGGKGHRLHKTTAAAWFAMVAAAARDGVALWPASGGAPCLRTIATQRAMRVSPLSFGLNPSMTVSLAPVGASTHQDGRRIDIGSVPPLNDLNRFGADGKKRRAWLLAHADEFGFRRSDFAPTPERDHNHFTHDGVTIAPAAEVVVPIENEDAMPAREVVRAEVETPVGGEFQLLLKNAKGDVSLVIGPARVDVVLNVWARDLAPTYLEVLPLAEGAEATAAGMRLVPAEVVQVRFIRHDSAADKDRSEGVALELVGNGGTTFGQLAGQIDLAKGERLRIQALTNSADPVLVGFSASLRVQK